MLLCDSSLAFASDVEPTNPIEAATSANAKSFFIFSSLSLNKNLPDYPTFLGESGLLNSKTPGSRVWLHFIPMCENSRDSRDVSRSGRRTLSPVKLPNISFIPLPEFNFINASDQDDSFLHSTYAEVGTGSTFQTVETAHQDSWSEELKFSDSVGCAALLTSHQTRQSLRRSNPSQAFVDLS